MDCIHDFNNEIQMVFDECQRQIEQYPIALRSHGLQYLETYHMLREKGKKNYICYLLPFWLQSTFRLDIEVSRKIAVGNIFAMLYFYIQDAVMDRSDLQSKTELLSLCNLFYLDFLDPYRHLFSSESPFWEYLRYYTQEWTEAILWEKDVHWKKYTEFSSDDFVLVAHKAAPLKITFAAMSLLGGQRSAIEALDIIIDRLLIQLQLLDDWHDWQKDLIEGNCTYLLTEAMQYGSLTDFECLTESHVKKAIYVGNIFDTIYELSATHCDYIQNYDSLLDICYLKYFSQYMMEDFIYIRKQIQSHIQKTMDGGFCYWLETGIRPR